MEKWMRTPRRREVEWSGSPYQPKRAEENIHDDVQPEKELLVPSGVTRCMTDQGVGVLAIVKGLTDVAQRVAAYYEQGKTGQQGYGRDDHRPEPQGEAETTAL